MFIYLYNIYIIYGAKNAETVLPISLFRSANNLAYYSIDRSFLKVDLIFIYLHLNSLRVLIAYIIILYMDYYYYMNGSKYPQKVLSLLSTGL